MNDHPYPKGNHRMEIIQTLAAIATISLTGVTIGAYAMMKREISYDKNWFTAINKLLQQEH